MQDIIFDKELIQRCQTNAPRYTSYPTADKFNNKFNNLIQLKLLENIFSSKDEPISLYIHVPFCNTLCLYCACNKIITNDRSKIDVYITYLIKEIELYTNIIGRKLKVRQLHFGGGSPSWLSKNQISLIMSTINNYFQYENNYEIAMELDPRHINEEFLDSLKLNLFNRVSFGVQDFTDKVQKAVNRIQSFQQTASIINYARSIGFKSINIDLIYGLPFQTVHSFSETLEKVITIDPDRIALFNYAHLPQIFMSQTRINADTLPSNLEKLEILQMSVNKLLAKGYNFIGMDHFAKNFDELTIALNNRTLHRNFQGYSTFANTNMLSFGSSSIGFIGDSYYQNHKELKEYYSLIDEKQLPILRGIILNNDDKIRRDIIQNIMCRFHVNKEDIECKFNIIFNEYFKNELHELKELITLGLTIETKTEIVVTKKGRFLVRNIAKIFDSYLKKNLVNNTYSQVI